MMSFFDRFLIATRYDLRALYVRYRDFVRGPFTIIKAYYLSTDASLPNSAFTELIALTSAVEEALQAFATYKASLQIDGFHELLEKTEDMKFYLHSVPLLPRLMRLSKRGLFNKQIVVNQSLERYAEGTPEGRDGWVQLAIDNNLFETDYSGRFASTLSKAPRRYELSSVTDTIDEESVLGRDLPVSLELVEGDYKVLNNQETLIQSAQILTQLLRNQNPNFPLIGVSKELFLSNVSSLIRAVAPRQILDNFRSDDSFSTVNVGAIEINNGTAQVQIEMTTIAGQVENDTISISL